MRRAREGARTHAPSPTEQRGPDLRNPGRPKGWRFPDSGRGLGWRGARVLMGGRFLPSPPNPAPARAPAPPPTVPDARKWRGEGGGGGGGGGCVRRKTRGRGGFGVGDLGAVGFAGKSWGTPRGAWFSREAGGRRLEAWQLAMAFFFF